MAIEWNAADLKKFGAATEIQLASRRPDGTLRPWVTIWAVPVAGGLYVRSANGPGNPWYRRALESGTGSIRAGSLERPVRFLGAQGEDHLAIDAAYHAKYDHYGARIVGSVVGTQAAAATLRLEPITR